MNRKELEEEWSKYVIPLCWGPRLLIKEETEEGVLARINFCGVWPLVFSPPVGEETTIPGHDKRFGLSAKIDPHFTPEDMHRQISAVIRSLLRYQYQAFFIYDNRELQYAFDKSPRYMEMTFKERTVEGHE